MPWHMCGGQIVRVDFSHHVSPRDETQVMMTSTFIVEPSFWPWIHNYCLTIFVFPCFGNDTADF